MIFFQLFFYAWANNFQKRVLTWTTARISRWCGNAPIFSLKRVKKKLDGKLLRINYENYAEHSRTFEG